MYSVIQETKHSGLRGDAVVETKATSKVVRTKVKALKHRECNPLFVTMDTRINRWNKVAHGDFKRDNIL